MISRGVTLFKKVTDWSRRNFVNIKLLNGYFFIEMDLGKEKFGLVLKAYRLSLLLDSGIDRFSQRAPVSDAKQIYNRHRNGCVVK